ncbi:MAG: 12-oxophytodienoate reductase [Gammaproteobacteria bacterium]
MNEVSLATLFSPINIAGMVLPNRVVMAPMTRSFCGPAGVPGEAVADYYAARAAGGCGLIITEGTVINMTDARGYNGIPAICNDEQQSGWQRVTDAVHQAGGKIAIQLWHTGRLGHSRAMQGGHPLAPSAITADGLFRDFGDSETLGNDIPYEQPLAMTADQINRVIDDFAAAAGRARAAGFDAIELHGANGYLIHTFLNPWSNQRNDEFGGDMAGRTEFAVRIIRAVRQAIGDLPLCIRLSQHAVNDYHWVTWASQQELQPCLQLLKAAGVDLLHSSGYRLEAPAFADGESLVAAFKRLSGLPAIGSGGITYSNTTQESFGGEITTLTDPATGEQALATGQCDLIAVGRAMIANPDWANKIAAGKWRDLAPFNAAMLGSLI